MHVQESACLLIALDSIIFKFVGASMMERWVLLTVKLVKLVLCMYLWERQSDCLLLCLAMDLFVYPLIHPWLTSIFITLLVHVHIQFMYTCKSSHTHTCLQSLCFYLWFYIWCSVSVVKRVGGIRVGFTWPSGCLDVRCAFHCKRRVSVAIHVLKKKNKGASE